MRRFAVTLALLAVAAAGVRAAPPQQTQWDDQAVARAIQRAKKHLWSRWGNGHWPEPAAFKNNAPEYEYGGRTALYLYALLAAGEDPQGPRVTETLKWLSAAKMSGTYAVALRANVWDMLGPGSKYRRRLREDVDKLVLGTTAPGMYGYFLLTPVQKSDTARRYAYYDNSNSQIAVLGVWAGQRSGIPVARKYWQQVEEHWLSVQNDDGGWGYKKDRSYGSMSAAGVATLLICFDNLHTNKSLRCDRNETKEEIQRGLAWLSKNFSHTQNPRKGPDHRYYYYLYCVERVALAGGYKYFGSKDWYKLGAGALLARQRRHGGWGDHIETAFALLFLARGQHPVLFNKLKYDGIWNTRSRDLANLTRWITHTFEKPVNWQIVHVDTPVADWHDAPILYISGAEAPKFTNAEVSKLREYVNQGGVILSEAACGKAGFNVGMRNVYARMFPLRRLKPLPADHPIRNLHFRIADDRKLLAVTNGVRLLAIHSPADLSRPWQLDDPAGHADAYRLAANVYFFVTGRGSLRRRGVSHWPVAREFTPVETLKLAPVRYAGDYQPEPLAWRRFAVLMGNRHRLKVELSEPLAITELDSAAWPVAAMTGTGKFSFTAEERDALRKYFADGGTLIVDAAGGSKAFADAAEKELALVLPEGQPGRLSADHPIFTRAGPAIEKVAYRKAVQAGASPPTRPRLRVIVHDGRIAVVFSREDLTAGLVGYPCWGLRGYTPESSFQIMRNLLLYASGKTLAKP